MSAFVLVHGAWHGGWCWKRVRARLQALGHEVFTPTLTGLCERAHLLTPEVDLETHITDVANLIEWEELTDVVLCGHSYAGCVVMGVADRMPERIRALVYLDAFVPEDGESLYDTIPAPVRDGQLEGVQRLGEGWKVPPIRAADFSVNAADAAWVDRMCTMQPLATFRQKIRLSGGIAQVENVTFILTEGWGPSPFPPFYEKARARGWRTAVMPCGHDAMLDLPEELARELVEAARNTG